MHYHLPIIPHDWETFKEGLGRGAVDSPDAVPLILGDQQDFPCLQCEGISLRSIEKFLHLPTGP